MTDPIVVVGGGVAGLAAAYMLQKKGANVKVLEALDVASGASYGNGGWICPAQAGPIAEPGLTLFALRSFIDHRSALYFQPSRLIRLTPWLLRFLTYANESDYRRGVEVLAALSTKTFQLVEELAADGAEFELHRLGMLMTSADSHKAETALAKLQPMRTYGYSFPNDVLKGGELHELEPALSSAAQAGFVVNEHWHVKPDQFTRTLGSAFEKLGGEIVSHSPVTAFNTNENRVVSVETPDGAVPCQHVILAAGAWTSRLAKRAAVYFPMEAGKGYSFFVTPSIVPSHCIELLDVHVGCTPLGSRVRIGGTMEFSGLNRNIDRRRVASIVNGSRRFFEPWIHEEIAELWSGPRPMTPDGLPVIDRSPAVENLFVATGYSMLGMTLALPAADALSEFVLSGSRPEVLLPFRLDRFPRTILRRPGMG